MFEQIPNYIEIQVIDWMKKLFNFGENSSGLLVNGGSMANYVALSVARYEKTTFDVLQKGFQTSDQFYTIYCSSETHLSVYKATEQLGFGRDAIRKIKVNEQFELDVNDLRKQIKSDIDQGYKPICIVANVGTVNTAAIDDVDAIADICRENNMWMHVDGAFGALLILSAKHRNRVSSIDKADSLAFDFHKWMHINYSAACVLIKDEQSHRNTFSSSADYVSKLGRGVLPVGLKMFPNYGMELSREFNALKRWMSIKENGTLKFGRLIDQNIEQAQYLGKIITDHESLELLAPISMQIVCFRYHGKLSDEEKINRLNQEILLQIQEKGMAVPSSTVISGKYAIRVNITNHRTKRIHLDKLIKNIIDIANELGQN